MCDETEKLAMIHGNGVILNVLSACNAEKVLRKAFCGKKAAIFK